MKKENPMYGICLYFLRSNKWQSLDNSSCRWWENVRSSKQNCSV